MTNIERVRIAVFFAIWLAIWIGLWLAGGLMFPHLNFPADIGGFVGFLEASLSLA